MGDLSRRVQGLSPERQRLLELLKQKAPDAQRSAEPAAVPADAGESPAEHAPLRLDYATSADETKENNRKFYNGVSTQLDATPLGSFSYFLNYGYVANESPQLAVVELPAQYINRNSVKLVLELVGDCDLSGKSVLDVGCGRGGTLYVIQQFFTARALTGLDLSANAIQFCKRTHKYPNTTFREGDAERLPFADAAFDTVTNVESSHGYPNIRAFYLEVWRVLQPGGYFLYTDVMQRDKSAQCLGVLVNIGFEVERDRDITRNVILSCDDIAATRVQAFQGANDPALMANFLAAPGSMVYEEMNAGTWIYRILKLRKPVSA
jgi:phthiocerol/phenolphthiocerol synthesis type-I polyketide synthase E